MDDDEWCGGFVMKTYEDFLNGEGRCVEGAESLADCMLEMHLAEGSEW